MAIGIPEVEGITLDDVREEDFGIMGQSDVLPKVTNLNPGGPTRRVVELLSQGKFKVYEAFAKRFLPQAYWRSATGNWLDAKARDVDLERLQATKAVGKVKFQRAEAVGNATIRVGGVVATAPDEQGEVYRFITTEEVTAPNGTSEILVSVEAMEEGAAFNVGAGLITELKTAFQGWDGVTNDADWLVSEGTDNEEDGRVLEVGEGPESTTGLRRRIGLKWRSGNQCNEAAYKLWALTAGAKDVVIKQLRGPGSVDVFITGPTGPPTAFLIGKVEAALGDTANGAPATDDWVVYSPVQVAMNWDLELIMYPGKGSDADAIKTVGLTVLNALHNPSVTVAGVSALHSGQDVILAQVFQALRVGGIGDLKKVNWNSPPADVTISANQIPVLGATPVITVSEAIQE